MKLTAADRCDRCAAAALVRVRLKRGHLDFCGHHYNKHAEALGAEPEIDLRDWKFETEKVPATV